MSINYLLTPTCHSGIKHIICLGLQLTNHREAVDSVSANGKPSSFSTLRSAWWLASPRWRFSGKSCGAAPMCIAVAGAQRLCIISHRWQRKTHLRAKLYHMNNHQSSASVWLTVNQEGSIKQLPFCPLWHSTWIESVLKSGSNERHFNVEAERVLRPCLASYCSGVT
jgi:hypothetical protein